MKERPILMSAPMVRAIMREENPKTQTRRIVKPQPPDGHSILPDAFGGWYAARTHAATHYKPTVADVRCPYGVLGDRLWVRETWQQVYEIDGDKRIMGRPAEVSYGQLEYAADCPDGHYPPRWRPSIHMPRWASRLTLEITDVRVQRVQDISEEDAIAEGAPGPVPIVSFGEIGEAGPATHRDGFRDIWDSINGPGSWTSNPWVWAITFRKVTP